MNRLMLASCLVVLASVSAPLRGQETVLDIGHRACLFLDDHFINKQSGLARTWHQGKPHAEVAIRAHQNWDRFPHLFGSVFRDPKSGMYRMYYSTLVFPAIKPPEEYTVNICYAESKDGKT